MSGATPILLYDGDCAFCARSVQFVLAHDRRRRDLRFASRQGGAGSAVLARHPVAAATDSLVWVDASGGLEDALVKYRAVRAIARYLGGPWGALGRLGWIVPNLVGDRIYDIVARHRHRLAGGAPACVVFSADEKARVLD